ncbi:A-kinase-interacting protein 1-like [Diadema antillarum]|uniref:A-kinase-interacting protein 1-like n=1 Tax=Diadema antillarum TaxID=105358 RepID=UPI003A89EE09
MHQTHSESWMSCTLCRASQQGMQVLERAKMREVIWPDPPTQSSPPMQDALAYTTIDEAFSSMLQFMTTSSRQCKRYYASRPLAAHSSLDRRHCSRFHVPTYTAVKQRHPLQKAEDVHIQVQPGTYAVTAGGWGKGSGQQTHVVHINAGQSVSMHFSL